MSKAIRYIIFLVLLQTVTSLFPLFAQQPVSVSGIVKDSITGEALPFVSVYFDGSTIGAMTDDNGAFSLSNNQGYYKLSAVYLGYDTKTIELKPGSTTDNLTILLKPTAYEISEVVVKPKRERYSRKNNPAVELIRQVIAHKDDNRIESKPEYQTEIYEKLSLSLDDFNPNLDKNKFLRKFKFIKNYLDTSEFNGKPILTVSVRENLSDFYYRKSPKTEKTIVKAKRMQGVDKAIDDGGGITSNLEEIFKSVNIFDNNITILLNRFVSPLSSTLATTYYHYYIMDTLDVEGDRCVDLAFVPANSESYGFTGRLYIMLDGSYAVKKVRLDTPANINLNWVDKLRIEQAFRSAFAALGDSSNVIPPMSLPLEEVSYSQVGASVGTKLDPSYGAYVFHEGLDFIVPRGTEVLAAAAGVVSRVENSKKFGRTVEITHAGGYKTVYAHLETVSVRRGEKVSRLEAIGTVGMTGKAFAPHLHYEVRQGEFTLDPVHYLFASVDAEEYANMLYMAVNTMQSMD